jgi:hypothetical protein
MTDDFFKAFERQLNPEQGKSAIQSTPSTQSSPAQESQTALALTSSPSAGLERSAGSAALPQSSESTPMVPAWWLAPACVLGALIAISAARWMY